MKDRGSDYGNRDDKQPLIVAITLYHCSGTGGSRVICSRFDSFSLGNAFLYCQRSSQKEAN